MNIRDIDRTQTVGGRLAQFFTPVSEGFSGAGADTKLHLLGTCRAVDEIVRHEMIIVIVGDEDIFQLAGVYMG